MLATWLVEFFLSKCNELDDLVASESISQDVMNLHAEHTIVEEDLKQFFSAYKVSMTSHHSLFDIIAQLFLSQSVLEPKTIYELIEGHGRTDMYLHFATVIEDFERVAEHYIMEEQWTKAIETLNNQVWTLVFDQNMTLMSDIYVTEESRAVLPIRFRSHIPISQRDGRFVASSASLGPTALGSRSPSATIRSSRPALPEPSHSIP